jgi:hypothetical protein
MNHNCKDLMNRKPRELVKKSLERAAALCDDTLYTIGDRGSFFRVQAASLIIREAMDCLKLVQENLDEEEIRLNKKLFSDE